ncbi:Phosphoribosylamine--glycine ligase [Enhygromyxa salina]|uniref:Phosphoribosylamine--glycine ligase n=1 Tax=Enhygromyxa salina TaxID=215803 RepID=A0A0C1ZAI7_9BACT|nr:phosphoribosylamine--glycine ligase [Enhygromyxa salina]KIG14644.1 Phosphoribosylamine--glycine ligase [Enhygromyxa salina]
MSTILIVGSGGREHALAWRCVSEGHRVVASPGSDALAMLADCFECPSFADLTALARRESVDLAIIGPEAPLVAGLANALRQAGIPTIGPDAGAAELEGSKAVAKSFMRAHAIPTARHVTVSSMPEALAALRSFAEAPVVKASGLAAGKGVTVAETHAQAEAAVRACLEGGRFGAAGAEVVLEQRLRGQEASFFVLTDGTAAACFEACQDHKRIGEGDTGPNTGGMGAYAPAPIVDDVVRGRVMDQVVAPTLAGLRSEGRPFIGVLFVGLMIDADRQPHVIEYNVRFGDPEVQPLMLGLQVPLVPRLFAAAQGAAGGGALVDELLPGRPAVSVVLASAGYPETSTKGVELRGLDEAMRIAGDDPELAIFHAGTQRDGALWRTNGGRVLGFCASGDDLRTALARAYGLADRVSVEGGQLRRDIAAHGLSVAPT